MWMDDNKAQHALFLSHTHVQNTKTPRRQQTLTGFYTARIGLRFLVEHHIVSRYQLSTNLG